MKNTVHCRFDPAARLFVRGPDAAVFLQGQFTNDLRRGLGPAVTYGLWLNQKGRVLADSFVLARGPNDFEVVSLTSPASVIRDRLEAYIIADDVTVEDATAGAEGWVVAGDGVSDALASLGLVPPPVGEFAVAAETVVFRARAASGPHWFVLSTATTSRAAWAEGGAQLVSRQELARGRIEAGVPEIPTELGSGDLPQEGGLEPEAISFTKGCYLGQEVMARLHNMGQVRRRLFVVRAGPEVAALDSGAELFVGERRVGEIRAFVSAGKYAVGLAMLHTSHVQVGAVLATNASGAAVIDVVRLAEGRAW